jgi:tripeptide aminopeptidase
MNYSEASQGRLLDTFLGLAVVDGATGNERAVAGAVRRYLDDLSIVATMDDAGATFGGEAGNLIAHVPGKVPAPALLLCAHLDTVLPTLGLKPVTQPDGLITSDGTTILGADDRAGIAIILEILHQLRERSIPHGPLDLVFTVAEEHGMHGAKALDISQLKASMGLIFDSSAPCGSFVIEAPGAVAFHAVVHGRAAHAAVSPQKGIHAIQIASQAISHLKLGRWGTTGMLNIGTIQGGTAINVIPDRVEIHGETRSPSRDELEAQKAHIREAFDGAAAAAGGSVALNWSPKYDGFSMGAEDPIVRAVTQGIAAAGFDPQPLRYPGGSDANILNGRGLACVNLGLGYRNVHSLQEAMPIQCLVDSVSIGLAIIGTIAKQAAIPQGDQP